MMVTYTTQITQITHMKQENRKSVQATVFRPEGITNSRAMTAKTMHRVL